MAQRPVYGFPVIRPNRVFPGLANSLQEIKDNRVAIAPPVTQEPKPVEVENNGSAFLLSHII